MKAPVRYENTATARIDQLKAVELAQELWHVIGRLPNTSLSLGVDGKNQTVYWPAGRIPENNVIVLANQERLLIAVEHRDVIRGEIVVNFSGTVTLRSNGLVLEYENPVLREAAEQIREVLTRYKLRWRVEKGPDQTFYDEGATYIVLLARRVGKGPITHEEMMAYGESITPPEVTGILALARWAEDLDDMAIYAIQRGAAKTIARKLSRNSLWSVCGNAVNAVDIAAAVIERPFDEEGRLIAI
jgi:hypothetical protein